MHRSPSICTNANKMSHHLTVEEKYWNIVVTFTIQSLYIYILYIHTVNIYITDTPNIQLFNGGRLVHPTELTHLNIPHQSI